MDLNSLKYVPQGVIGNKSTSVEVLAYYHLGPLLLTCLTLIPAWISNYTDYKVWDEITYPFLNFYSCTIEV